MREKQLYGNLTRFKVIELKRLDMITEENVERRRLNYKITDCVGSRVVKKAGVESSEDSVLIN